MRTKLFALVPLLLLAWSPIESVGREIGFVEDYVLAKDRAAALAQLIPGTEEYYYYHALHYLSTEQYDKAREILGPWVQRHGETGYVWRIRTRLAFLTYSKTPNETLDYVRHRTGLGFPHQKEDLSAEPNFPTKLDPASISRESFSIRANEVSPRTFNGYEDSAIDWLVGMPVDGDRRRNLLTRLTRPDYPNLVKMVFDDFRHPNSGGFGSIPIHHYLLLAQLEELVKLKPELLNHQAFVRAYLTKIQPNADDNWRTDPAKLQAHLDRLDNFADRLDPVHNTLKAHIQYQQLVLDRRQGKMNKGRFLAYLKLPRNVGYGAKGFLESDAVKRFPADLGNNYDGTTLLPPTGNDEPLIRSYLLHFLRDAADTKEFEPFINDVYLKYLLAETKITAGLGNAEQWASLLPPELYKQLKDRIDLDFAETNPAWFAADAPVVLDVAVKNVPTLIVKVFEINTGSFYRESQREIDTDINLDGLVANSEQTFQYKDPSARRVNRRFEFPQLNRAGVYVIDFIGNGKSSRALIRKGRLQHVVRTGATGQIFTVFQEQRKPVTDATLWIAGREYKPNDRGQVLVPFSTTGGRVPVIISQGDFSCLDYFQHETENYQLSAGIYVDRESLLSRKKATLVIRPGLSLNGTLAVMRLLENVKLNLTSVDLDGISSTQEIPNVALFDDRETTHEFQVPSRMASLTVTLSGQVKRNSAGGERQALAVSESFTLNEIERTDKTEGLHFLQNDQGYFVELLGKSGEPKASRPVVVSLKHRDFRQPFGDTLKTDKTGRIDLGKLHGIQHVSATGPQGITLSWELRGDRHSYTQLLHGKAGEPLSIPFLPQSGELTPAEVSLIELRGESFSTNRFANLKQRDGLLVIDGLAPGDYDLLLKSAQQRIRIRVADADRQGGYLVGAARLLESRRVAPVQIADVRPQGDQLQIRVVNSNNAVRVHVFASRFEPEYGLYNQLSRVRGSEPYVVQPASVQTVYVTGRNIGDEYSYILNRQQSTKLPGNMLERPSLLLNPWAVRDTRTDRQVAMDGAAFEKAGAPAPSAADRPMAPPQEARSAGGNFASLDFLADSSISILNLVPDEQGVIKIPLADLGTHQKVTVAAVDPLNTTVRHIALPEKDLVIVDQRLAKPLDSAQHFTQQKQVTVVTPERPFEVSDVTSGRFEVYDSLPRVYRLYSTLKPEPKLAEMATLMGWSKMKPEEQLEFYSKHASHELSFFLYKKDPKFFKEVIQPYLANKREKTFLDRWLLGEDLAEWKQPWRFAQLNTVERILLSQRLAGEQQHTSRHLRDMIALQPPNIDRFLQLFETAVKGNALSVDGTLLAIDQVELLREEASDRMVLELGKGVAGGFGGGGGRGGVMRGAAPGAPATPPGGGPAAALGRKSVSGKPSADSAPEAKAKKRESFAARRSTRADANRDKELKEQESVDESRKLAVMFDDLAGGEFDGDSQMARALYRQPESTKEWAENNYYHLPLDQQTAALVGANRFWSDYAAHDPKLPFVSGQFTEAANSFTEIMFALAVLDLPFEAPEHESKLEGTRFILNAKGPVIVHHEEIRPAPVRDQATRVLVGQTYFKHGERHMQVNGEQVDKYVTDEFLIHTVYGCQVVVTNPNSSRQKLSVLLQIPQGAIPVANGKVTKTAYLTLEPYHTQTLDYYFYFPASGKFQHFPVQVARQEELVAFAPATVLKVVDRPTRVDTKSWDYISQFGTPEETLAFLNENNVSALNLDRIAWRMHDAGFFDATIKLLSTRHVYNHTLWSYAVKHNHLQGLQQYLQHVDGLVADAGGRITSPILSVDPFLRRTLEHLEYRPLVNARAHALGARRQILNDRFFEQYHRWLEQVAFGREVTSDDALVAVYYLLLQDRVAEAQELFQKVKPEEIASRMQYDYCSAYLQFFQAEPEKARAIATRYLKHPVDRWRKAFEVIIAQLDEAAGAEAKAIDQQNRDQQQQQLASSEPSLDFQVEAKQIVLNYQNLDQVRINYYLMDVELLFSRNPFVQQFRGQFSAIKPNSTAIERLIDADAKAGTTSSGSRKIPLPADLRNRNVLVEIIGGGQTRTQAYYSHSLAVQVVENYGQVRVAHADGGKPVAKAYVKVYAQLASGEVKFYKDGYTDLRGRFDYASLSTGDLDTATKFSILIMSDEHGALVREAVPPKR